MRREIALFAVLAIGLVIGFLCGHWAGRNDCAALHSPVYAQAYSQAITDVSNCSLEDARADKCFIPCSTDTDCLEKNGMSDH